MEPFSAMWSYMRLAIVIYVKNCIYIFWRFGFRSEKVHFRAIFQKQVGLLLKPVVFYLNLALFWPPRPFLISKKKSTSTNKGKTCFKETWFRPDLIHFMFFFLETHFLCPPNLTYGKPGTYAPLSDLGHTALHAWFVGQFWEVTFRFRGQHFWGGPFVSDGRRF